MKAQQLLRSFGFSALATLLVAGCASTRRSSTDLDPRATSVRHSPADRAKTPVSDALVSDALTSDPLSGLSPAEAEEWRLYIEAVEAAMIPQPMAVSRDLLAIVKYNPKLVWNDQGQIRMVTWTKASYFPPDTVGKPQNLYGDTWLTAAPFTQEFCSSLGLRGEALDLRLKQYIGLPPNDDKDAFVEMWVDPADFFRPCPDPEINDHECQVSLDIEAPEGEAPQGTVGRTPLCPWARLVASTQPPMFEIRFDDQVSGAFVEVADSHLQWMCAQWVSAYPAHEPRQSYPWTALGYTYDWGSPDPVGASEFVAPAKTPVVIAAVTTTEEFCAPPP